MQVFIEFFISALLLLVLLLLLSTLNQLARPDDFRPRGRIRNQCLGDEHANVILIGFVLWIFTRRDVLSKVSGALEKQNQEDGTDASPAIWGVGGEAAPLVKHEPNGLFSKEVRVSAISPEAGCDEAPIQLSGCVSTGKFSSVLVFVFGGLISWHKVSTVREPAFKPTVSSTYPIAGHRLSIRSGREESQRRQRPYQLPELQAQTGMTAR